MTEPNAYVIVDNCFRLSMMHPTWEALGYRRRPRRGLIWEFLTPSWKKTIENKILRELLVIFAAAHLSAIKANGDVFQRVVDLICGDDGRFERLHGSKAAFVEAIREYLANPLGNWYAIFSDHLDVMDLPDQKLRAQLLVYGGRFVQGVLTMMNYMRRNLDMNSWRPPRS